MAMSDCLECWNTPCECGHDYQHWTIERLEAQIDMLAKLRGLKVMFRDGVSIQEMTPPTGKIFKFKLKPDDQEN